MNEWCLHSRDVWTVLALLALAGLTGCGTWLATPTPVQSAAGARSLMIAIDQGDFDRAKIQVCPEKHDELRSLYGTLSYMKKEGGQFSGCLVVDSIPDYARKKHSPRDGIRCVYGTRFSRWTILFTMKESLICDWFAVVEE